MKSLLLSLAFILVSGGWFGSNVTISLATSLPLASTVPLVDEAALPGSVIIYEEEADTFSDSRTINSDLVYGVVAVRPAIVLQTSSTSPTVITQGVTPLLVDTSGGVIKRGDLLITSRSNGVAMKADSNVHQYPFAIALEPFDQATPGLIQVEVNPRCSGYGGGKARCGCAQTAASDAAHP